MGTYTSTLPVFMFSYNYTINSYDYQDLWLKVVDVTDEVELFFETLESGSNDFYINTPVGHEIYVELSTYASVYTYEAIYISSSFSFTYDTAELPSCSPPPVRNITAIPSVYYSTLQVAYDDALDEDIIQSQTEVFNEDLYINLDKSVTLEGGYDCNYTPTTGETSLQGQMTISSGTVRIGNFRLMK